MTTTTLTPTHTEDREYQAAIDFLWSRINYERGGHIPYRRPEFGLSRMYHLMDLLGNPHRQLRFVHIAGTKGKGSVAAMAAAVLARCGLRVGLYTSPHLECLEERFVLDGSACSPADIVRYVERVRPAVEQLDNQARAENQRGPTFFEITTAMAFCYFAAAKADVVVLEVGMGGRLDSTNICSPDVCVITSISFDHTRQLGNTLAAIAGEKAGIIKPGVPVVTSVRHPEPLGVIRTVAERQGSPLFEIGRHFDIRTLPRDRGDNTRESEFAALPAGERIEYVEWLGGETKRIGPIQLGLLGGHQADNAAVAIAALQRLAHAGWPIVDEAISQGIAAARLPGRLEIVHTSPVIILDVAHNVASMAALVKFLDSHFPNRPRRFLLAISRDKDIRGIVEQVVPAASHLVVTRFVTNPRAASPEDVAFEAHRLAAAAGRSITIDVIQDPWEAWQTLRASAAREEVVCVTGSFFLVGELRRRILASVPR